MAFWLDEVVGTFEPDASLIREGHALGIDSVRTQSDGFGRTQGSQQTSEAASHFDGGGVWGSSQSACSSLSLYGPPRWLHRTSCERSHGSAMGRNQLRKLGDRNQRRVCSKPGHEAEVRVLAGRITVGSGCRNHSARMEAALSGDGGRLGFPQPAHSEPTILARCGRRCSMPRRYEPRFRDGSAGIRFVTAIVAWLDETGAPLGVQQKLMRHANISTTMNVYGGAFMESKRKANTSAVQRVLVQDHTKIAKRPSGDGLCCCGSNLIGTISDHNQKTQFLVTL